MLSPIAKLNQIICRKNSRICLSADCMTMADLYDLINKTATYICAVKVHSDIIDEFDGKTLRKLSQIHDFVIIDDRKFADIGNTVMYQAKKITLYSDFITVHSLPGQSILDGLRRSCVEDNCGILLLAQMSTAGNLITPEYTSRTIQLAEANKDIVSGFICQEKLTPPKSGFLHFSPGCKLGETGDQLGQQYNTPKDLLDKGIDILIVGRGIYATDDPAAAAKMYRDACGTNVK